VSLRPISTPFVVAPPSGARIRTRLRIDGVDEVVLREVGDHLGRLAGRDLASRSRLVRARGLRIVDRVACQRLSGLNADPR